ncbi:hypothetical protein, partial [Candidatus Protofrankia californiensis]|uniref:hypothetical protein n=1 Tax=Candidatus Protofrankia californiensis TaxID=1839754 RepID=UPI0019D222E5
SELQDRIACECLYLWITGAVRLEGQKQCGHVFLALPEAQVSGSPEIRGFGDSVARATGCGLKSDLGHGVEVPSDVKR